MSFSFTLRVFPSRTSSAEMTSKTVLVIKSFYRCEDEAGYNFIKRSSMISIEISDPALETATANNQTGEWCFLISTVNGKQISPEEVFCRSGTWKDARAKA